MRILAVLLLTLSLAACVPPEPRISGYRFQPEALARLQPGQTTEEQALRLLGSPSSTTDFEVERWHYIYKQEQQISVLDPELEKMQVVTLEFDDSGILKNIDRKDTKDARDVAIVERETPTEGRDFSVVKQLVGNLGRFNGSDVDRATIGHGTGP